MKSLKTVVIATLLVLLGGVGGYFVAGYRMDYLSVQRNKDLSEKRQTEWLALKQALADEISRFNGEVGFVVKDLKTNREISFNKDKLFPSASLVKVPIMAACFLSAAQGNIKLERNIALKASDKLTGSGALKDMPAGSTFSVERLIGLMIYDSDNTATNIITNLMGINYLNSTFKVFGLKNTALSRKIADYQLRDQGIENYTTAEDMASLFEKMYLGKIYSKSVSGQCIAVLKLARTNDRIPKYLPPQIAVAHKTGLENGVCHDGGLVFTPKGDFVITVLTKHGNSDSLLSKEFIATIAKLVYEYIEQI